MIEIAIKLTSQVWAMGFQDLGFADTGHLKPHRGRFMSAMTPQSSLNGLITSTGTGEFLMTRSATEPNMTLSRPLRP
jgi:hypothetical protein